MVLMAPSDEVELMHMVATAAVIDDRPSALRYPRGEGLGLDLPKRGTVLEIGRGRVVREGTKVAILALGPRLQEALRAADELAARGLSTTVADARFAKPLDTALITQLANHHEVVITIEDNVSGGFGSAVMHYMALSGLLDGGVKVRPMTIPDRLIDHNTPAGQSIEAGLTAKDIVATALSALGIATTAGAAVRA
jgi:1-deoxy-D-xylulose-5-phosphate synthase